MEPDLIACRNPRGTNGAKGDMAAPLSALPSSCKSLKVDCLIILNFRNGRNLKLLTSKKLRGAHDTLLQAQEKQSASQISWMVLHPRESEIAASPAGGSGTCVLAFVTH